MQVNKFSPTWKPWPSGPGQSRQALPYKSIEFRSLRLIPLWGVASQKPGPLGQDANVTPPVALESLRQRVLPVQAP